MTSIFLPNHRRAALAAIALVLSACSSLVEAPTDDVIAPGALDNAAALPTVAAGAAQDFNTAFVGDQGNQEGIILVSGLVADEYDNGDTFPTRREMDQRAMRENNVSLDGVERNLHRARAAAERVAEAYGRLAPTNLTGRAEMLTLAGFVNLAFAENYCSGVPTSSLNPDGTIAFGSPLTTAQLLDRAIAKADTTLTLLGATSTARFANRARMLRGRALLNRGQFAQAAAAVAAVPTSFRDSTLHSALTPNVVNGIFWFNSTNSRRWTVSNGRGAAVGSTVLAYQTLADPRVVVTTSTSTTFDRVGPLRILRKYTSAASGVSISDGIEARLIEAEAALQASDITTFLARLNDLRATQISPALPAVTDPGTASGRQNLLFQERALWLFATGHRLADMRRLIRQYGRTQASVFPTGTYFKGGTYGTDVNIIITQDERNNPTFTGCLNRDA